MTGWRELKIPSRANSDWEAVDGSGAVMEAEAEAEEVGLVGGGQWSSRRLRGELLGRG